MLLDKARGHFLWVVLGIVRRCCCSSWVEATVVWPGRTKSLRILAAGPHSDFLGDAGSIPGVGPATGLKKVVAGPRRSAFRVVAGSQPGDRCDLEPQATVIGLTMGTPDPDCKAVTAEFVVVLLPVGQVVIRATSTGRVGLLPR